MKSLTILKLIKHLYNLVNQK